MSRTLLKCFRTERTVLKPKLKLNVAIATNAFLATLIVGLGQGSLVLPVATAVAALLALRFTDATGRFHLNRWGVNGVVILSAIVGAWRYATSQGGVDMFVAADALAMLQLALFFEKKGFRTWWDLLSLGLLQVVLASLGQYGPAFGLLLIPYAFTGLAAMVLLHQVRSIQEAHERSGTHSTADGEDETQGAEKTNWKRLLGIALGTLIVGPLSLYLRFGHSRPHAGGAGNEVPASMVARGRNESRYDVMLCGPSPEPETNRELWRRVAVMTFFCVVSAYVVFAFSPRMKRVEFGIFVLRRVDPSEAFRRTIGFSGHVRLDEEGDTSDDHEKVLEVELTDYATGQPYVVRSEIYLRGAVFNHYSNGQWSYVANAGSESVPLVANRVPSSAQPLVRQLVTIEALDQRELFGVWPFLLPNNNQYVQFDVRKQRLLRQHRLRDRRFSYQLVTNGLDGESQATIVPAMGDIRRQRLVQWPSQSLPQLVSLANSLLEDNKVSTDDPIACSQVLESHLRSSTDFDYSLRGIRREAGIDPIEDFIRYHPQGHCEYFASTLVLMLRSLGLPARLVVGFKTGEARLFSETYIARQSHAHAWVEMYIPANQLPAELVATRGGDWSRGGWLRLDPTPVDLGGSDEGLASGFSLWWERVRELWTAHVVRMTRARQRASIYGPIVDKIRNAFSLLGNGDWWRTVLASRLKIWGADPWQLVADVGRAWGVFLVLLVLVIALKLSRSAYRSLFSTGHRHRKSQRHKPRATVAEIGFYRRLERLLESPGIKRQASQTPREFTEQRAARLAETSGAAHVVPLAQQIVDVFYQVRFGRSPLEPEQVGAVERALRQIRQATRTHPMRPSRKRKQ